MLTTFILLFNCNNSNAKDYLYADFIVRQISAPLVKQTGLCDNYLTIPLCVTVQSAEYEVDAEIGEQHKQESYHAVDVEGKRLLQETQ